MVFLFVMNSEKNLLSLVTITSWNNMYHVCISKNFDLNDFEDLLFELLNKCEHLYPIISFENNRIDYLIDIVNFTEKYYENHEGFFDIDLSNTNVKYIKKYYPDEMYFQNNNRLFFNVTDVMKSYDNSSINYEILDLLCMYGITYITADIIPLEFSSELPNSNEVMNKIRNYSLSSEKTIMSEIYSVYEKHNHFIGLDSILLLLESCEKYMNSEYCAHIHTGDNIIHSKKYSLQKSANN